MARLIRVVFLCLVVSAGPAWSQEGPSPATDVAVQEVRQAVEIMSRERLWALGCVLAFALGVIGGKQR